MRQPAESNPGFKKGPARTPPVEMIVSTRVKGFQSETRVLCSARWKHVRELACVAVRVIVFRTEYSHDPVL